MPQEFSPAFRRAAKLSERHWAELFDKYDRLDSGHLNVGSVDRLLRAALTRLARRLRRKQDRADEAGEDPNGRDAGARACVRRAIEEALNMDDLDQFACDLFAGEFSVDHRNRVHREDFCDQANHALRHFLGMVATAQRRVDADEQPAPASATAATAKAAAKAQSLDQLRESCEDLAQRSSQLENRARLAHY